MLQRIVKESFECSADLARGRECHSTTTPSTISKYGQKKAESRLFLAPFCHHPRRSCPVAKSAYLSYNDHQQFSLTFIVRLAIEIVRTATKFQRSGDFKQAVSLSGKLKSSLNECYRASVQ